MSGAQGNAESSCKLYGKSCCGFSCKSVDRFQLGQAQSHSLNDTPPTHSSPHAHGNGAKHDHLERHVKLHSSISLSALAPARAFCADSLKRSKNFSLCGAKLNMRGVFPGKSKEIYLTARKSRCQHVASLNVNGLSTGWLESEGDCERGNE
jgi:hypothetical protein